MLEGKVRSFWLLTVAVLSGCAGCVRAFLTKQMIKAGGAVVADRGRCEVGLRAVTQLANASRMHDWAQAAPALLGSRGGKYEDHFVFPTDAWVEDLHDAVLELGARSRAAYESAQRAKHKGPRPDNTPADYTEGDPVQIFVEREEGGRIRRLAYEDVLLEKIKVAGSETVKPWTPHLVFHGSGVLSDSRTGSIPCTHDCPGGIIGNDQYPVIEPPPMLRAHWPKLPGPGSKVVVVARPVPSGGN